MTDAEDEALADRAMMALRRVSPYRSLNHPTSLAVGASPGPASSRTSFDTARSSAVAM